MDQLIVRFFVGQTLLSKMESSRDLTAGNIQQFVRHTQGEYRNGAEADESNMFCI